MVQDYGAYFLNGYASYKEGVGTLRATGGNNGGGSETLITEKTQGKRHIEKYRTQTDTNGM